MAGERYGMRGASCGLREPSFYLGFTQFKLCHFIHFPMSPLGSKWLPTAFTVKADIFIKVHRPLHAPPSATPANSILLSSYHSAMLSLLHRFKLTDTPLPEDICADCFFFLKYFPPGHVRCSFTSFRPPWKCHFVTQALSESSSS